MKQMLSNWNGLQWGCAFVVTLFLGFVLFIIILVCSDSTQESYEDNHGPIAVSDSASPGSILWNGFPERVRQVTVPVESASNVHPDDYVGPDRCRNCHEENHRNWSQHPHRWMNARASASTIKGDFSATAAFSYHAGDVSFSHVGDQYRMHLSRDNVTRVYRVTQTIGSRFIQDYVGRLESGPEPPEHPFYHDDHVLPFAWSLTENEWEPVANVIHEPPEGERPDPFSPQDEPRHGYAVYASNCNYCHTTFPLGDMLLRDPELIGQNAPRELHWDVKGYVEGQHPELVSAVPAEQRNELMTMEMIVRETADFDAAAHAVTLGISCEACHLGGSAHVADPTKKPGFFPASPYLLAADTGQEIEVGRTHDNVNWICGRCHASRHRPTYAAGMATWNSIEYSDAMQGSCYSQLTCITCHEPHTKIGQEWAPTTQQDNRKCLNCHPQYESAEDRSAHTHHPIDSPGSDCMNCHMPRITQGINGMVRTHAILSPTRQDMLEANHPNACNMCHTDQSIGWTLAHLSDWYGPEMRDLRIDGRPAEQRIPAAITWLAHKDEAVRLVAADALARSEGTAAVPKLIPALDDPYLINRRFLQRQLQRILNVRLRDFGYQSWMTPEERRPAIEEIRAQLAPASPVDPSPAVPQP